MPEGTKLTDMPALVEQIPSAPAYTDSKRFYQRSGLDSIDVQNVVYVDFSKAKNITGCFFNCSNLTSLALPAGFGEAAITITACFQNCSSLTSLVLPDGFCQNAENILRCFYNCSSLTTLHLPTGFGQNSTSNKYCFSSCVALTTITGNPNFKATVDLAPCKNLTHDSIMVIINGLQTVTTTQTLTLGSTNLAKLTEADKQIATDKGWTLA